MKSPWKDYFIFSEKELKAVVVVGVFVLASTTMAVLFPARKKTVHLFYFDPNTIDSISAIQLGLSTKQYATLSNFRKKGGRFYLAKDIFKWYGVRQDVLKSLYPYVRIKVHPSAFNKYASKRGLDINLASVSDLVALGFVQSKLANRIIQYRGYLGGYKSLEELKKVYGMNEHLFLQIRPLLSLKKGVSLKMHWATMNYTQMDQLGIFNQREIWQILRNRKEQGKVLDWVGVVVQFDLSREQARKLKDRTDIR